MKFKMKTSRNETSADSLALSLARLNCICRVLAIALVTSTCAMTVSAQAIDKSQEILAPAPELQGNKKTSNAPFLTPKEAVDKMDIPEGFEVSIYAAEPDIGEPIAFTFDGRGRIWVVENYNYINRGVHDLEPLSRIQILEDTDSDGVFDTKKLFTDKIGFSSGIAVGFGGVYLGTPPNLLFIPDADGDDVPDGEPEVLLDGWGVQDRHETLNSFIWGPDGWLYGCHGVLTRSFVGKAGAPDSERQYIDGGIWRFHPVRKEFEIFAEGLSNPWGFDFNDVGHGFATCCVIPHLFHIAQGGIYDKQSSPNLNPYAFDVIKTIRDHTHRSAHGGARFYLADTFPEKYRDQLFMCNIHEHAVLTDYMEVKGSSYIGRHGEDFLPANDLAWVGFSVLIGPDGGVYILDWHDTDICGNSINFPDSGRIYRIMPEGAKKISRPNIGASSDLALVKLQDHANDWYVRQARVELHARAAAGRLDLPVVHQGLHEMFEDATTSGKRLRALWALHVTGGLDAGAMLAHEDQYVRSWAVQLISETGNISAATFDTFAQMAREDKSAVVRLYLASALQRMSLAQRLPLIRLLAGHAEDVDDANIPRMLWFALEPTVPVFPEEALAVAIDGKIPYLQESVARRMSSGSLAWDPNTNQGTDAQKAEWKRIVDALAPGFIPFNINGKRGGVQQLLSFRNERVVQTAPQHNQSPSILRSEKLIPEGKRTALALRVSYHPHGGWRLRVLVNNDVLVDRIVSYETVQDEWLELEIDLSKYAGQRVELSLENGTRDWLTTDLTGELAYWSKVEIVSR